MKKYDHHHPLEEREKKCMHARRGFSAAMIRMALLGELFCSATGASTPKNLLLISALRRLGESVILRKSIAERNIRKETK